MKTTTQKYLIIAALFVAVFVLVIAKSVQLPNRRIAQVRKHGHAAVPQVELAKVAARTEIKVSPVFPLLFCTTA